jgi:UDP-N-acetylglucosamine--N-acetylmuramyl-(pentapeptide) pyrophosphoryl-undecaprenol N-acetylglucosamine transferase
MNVIFTCGGTAGHINPALALAKMLRQRRPDCNILFVGAEDGMENKLVPREGFRLETVRISNFQRKLTPAGLWHNAVTAKHILEALRKADRILKDFQPDVIVGTGGYASFPALRQGARRGIPTAVHESNAVPGLATRLVADQVDRIMVPYEECRSSYKHPDRVVVTGTPVQEAFIFTKKREARAALGLDDRPVVVSFWGSLGAREMNKKITRFMEREVQDGQPFHHIHATGSYGWRWMPDYVKEHGVDLSKADHIDMREYIYDMPQVMAAADLVICRAGASTFNEVAAAAKPCVVVPSPNVTDNHQEKNARLWEARGAVKVLREADCDGDVLYDLVTDLVHSPEQLAMMESALRDMAVLDAAERIYQTILELAKK